MFSVLIKKEFIPKRRRVQKFCSASCRVSSHRLKKPSTIQQNQQEVSQNSYKKNLKELGIATVGTVAGNTLQNKLTPLKNRAAAKGDLQHLESVLKEKERYHEVKNQPGRIDGAVPFFDTIRKEIVYFKVNKEKLLKV